ncbi:MAG: hypothetical protein AMXMBFR84_03230 [Candidatus Hydrogenedentota bacterium]
MSQAVTVIIPTWNHGDLLNACLNSLADQIFQKLDIIVVDDASSDGTVNAAVSGRQNVRILRNETNRGFAASANRGLREATSDWVMLLNNDVTLAPDAIDRLVNAVESEQADMVQPLILWRDAPDRIYSAGDRQRLNGRPEGIGFRDQREGFRFDEPVFGVTAAAALYRREIFDRVGYLDETFLAYFEDSDLNFRARLAGFQAACVPEAVAWHVGSASQSGKTWWRSRQCFRNHALLVVKNMPWPLLIRYAPSILRERLHQISMLIGSARAEFGLAKALAIAALAIGSTWRALLPSMMKRFNIQRNRAVDLQTLRDLLRE